MKILTILLLFDMQIFKVEKACKFKCISHSWQIILRSESFLAVKFDMNVVGRYLPNDIVHPCCTNYGAKSLQLKHIDFEMMISNLFVHILKNLQFVCKPLRNSQMSLWWHL